MKISLFQVQKKSVYSTSVTLRPTDVNICNGDFIKDATSVNRSYTGGMLTQTANVNYFPEFVNQDKKITKKI